VNGVPDATALHRFLSRVRTRLLIVRAMEGLGAGCVMAALIVVAGARTVPVTVGLVLVAVLVRLALGDQWRFRWWQSPTDLAGRVEQRTTLGRNLIITAVELLADPRQAGSGYVRNLVVARAARLVKELNPSAVFPARTAVVAFATGTMLLVTSLFLPIDTVARGRSLTGASGAPSIGRVEVVVTPPAYSGLPATTRVNPSRIEALANSRIEIRVVASASSVALETITGTQEMRLAGGAHTIALTAEVDGFLALEPRDSSGTAGPRHLVGLVVTPDQPPRVTLRSPGRDLFFSTVPGSIPLTLGAEDDVGVGSLRLRYTAVSGSGERFTFVERDVPVTVSAANPLSWTATGTWRLVELGLEPGDLVVYRAIATDRRPGSAPVESESYVIEVVTPGAIAAEGFAADDQRDRYAVSQQMVILKTERLMARRASLQSDSVADEARLLAAEQRQVRAEFVFMMGGELEDAAEETSGTLELNEVAEAEAEGDLLAGRLQNQGRVDMMRAIRAMSRASRALTDANLDQALSDERAALENLMRAFSRTRFILRALTQRERIDLDRRLSGALQRTAGLSGPAVEAAPPGRVAVLRRLLADLATLDTDSSAATADRASAAALALLRADPASDAMRRLAGRIQDVAVLARSRGNSGLRLRVDSLLSEITQLAAMSLPTAPLEPFPVRAGELAGALRDAALRAARPR
jgi:hypothetical protein